MKMKWEESGYKSEAARAEGLGAAHHGPSHWLAQRVTALANLIFVIWAVLSAARLMGQGAGHAEWTAWLSTGVNPVLAVLLCLSLFYHAWLGLRVVIEDYVHGEGTKFITLMMVQGLVVVGAAICLFSVLKISL